MMVRHLMESVDQELMDQDWAANVVLHLMANVVLDLTANVDPHLMAIVVLDLTASVDQDPMDQDPMDLVQAANVVLLEAVHLVHHNRSALNEQTRNLSQTIGSTLLPMRLK